VTRRWPSGLSAQVFTAPSSGRSPFLRPSGVPEFHGLSALARGDSLLGPNATRTLRGVARHVEEFLPSRGVPHYRPCRPGPRREAGCPGGGHALQPLCQLSVELAIHPFLRGRGVPDLDRAVLVQAPGDGLAGLRTPRGADPDRGDREAAGLLSCKGCPRLMVRSIGGIRGRRRFGLPRHAGGALARGLPGGRRGLRPLWVMN